jgi:hypothetical protein
MKQDSAISNSTITSTRAVTPAAADNTKTSAKLVVPTKGGKEVPPHSFAALRPTAANEGVLAEARALRQQAEELCKSRQGNVEALEQQMADLRRRSKEELIKMEKRNRELAADNEALRRDLALKSTRAQRESDVARQWEAAWTSESDQRRQLAEKLKETERNLNDQRLEHAHEKGRRETVVCSEL